MMAIIEHALDGAPAGGHRELWLTARPAVRRRVGRLVGGGVEARHILVVIADHGTVVAEVVAVLWPEMVIQVREPFVAVLVGDRREVVAAVLGDMGAYLATVPAGSVAVVTAPAGTTPVIAMSRMVDRRLMS